MIKIKEPISFRNYGFSGATPVEICLDGYRLADDTEVMFIQDKWIDNNEYEYTAVYRNGEIIGFNKIYLKNNNVCDNDK